jgi:hypothetical protein
MHLMTFVRIVRLAALERLLILLANGSSTLASLVGA